MYRDAAEWSEIRNRIIEQGMPIRQVARKCGVSRSTVRKMLKHPLPEPYAGADRVRPKLGPYTASIGRLLHEKHLHPAFGRAVRSRNLRAYPRRRGFSGTYRTVLRYAQSLLPTAAIVGQSACDLLASSEEEARDLLFLIPTKPRLLAEGQSGSIAKMRGSRDQARLAAFEWIHAVLQNKVKRDALRRQVANVTGFDILLDHPYKGRLSDRSRALVVLASRCGLTKRTGVVREAVVNSSTPELRRENVVWRENLRIVPESKPKA